MLQGRSVWYCLVLNSKCAFGRYLKSSFSDSHKAFWAKCVILVAEFLLYGNNQTALHWWTKNESGDNMRMIGSYNFSWQTSSWMICINECNRNHHEKIKTGNIYIYVYIMNGKLVHKAGGRPHALWQCVSMSYYIHQCIIRNNKTHIV